MQFLTNSVQEPSNQTRNKFFDIEEHKATLSAFSKKVAFFLKNQLGIGQSWRKLAEIGQKWNFRALFSEICMKIEVFSSLERNYTRAQLAARLTFFI